MPTLVTLAEAATFLGVSKATLRNWDKEGKLKAYRHPLNQYRSYDLEELRPLRVQPSLLDDEPVAVPAQAASQLADIRAVRRLVARLHGILRDTDGGSSIIQRFDELTKLLFLRLFSERDDAALFGSAPGEDGAKYAQRLRKAYAQCAANHPDLIPARFAALEASDAAIAPCGAALAAVTFAGLELDVKGVAYEEVLRGTFDKSDHQQFFTPHQVVGFVTAMLGPYLSGTVADPACGTAGFLVEVLRTGARHGRLVGLEIDERLAWVAGINLLLHGAADFECKCLGDGGSLGPRALPFAGTCDVILTNPPFGSELTDPATLEQFELGRGRTSRRRGILFLERCWDLLRDGGVVGIVLDEGVLNLPSASDVRQFILDRFEILAIVGLPDTAFQPYASVNASILFLRKTTGPVPSRRVFFGKAEKIGRKSNGDDDLVYDDGGLPSENSDLPQILERWRALQAGGEIGADELAFVADVTANLAGDASLRLDFRYHHPSRHLSRDLLHRSRHQLVDLADLCQERNDVLVPSTEMPDQVILYTGLAHIESGNGIAHQVPTPAASLKSAVKRYEPNDIVFARMRPNLRKVALMAFAEGGYVSPECTVLTVRADAAGERLMDPALLAAILRSELVYGQIMHLIAGIGRPRLNTTDLRRVRLPLAPTTVQRAIKASYEGRIGAARQLRVKAQALLEEAQRLEWTAVDHLARETVEG